jgi:hypothetical protein
VPSIIIFLETDARNKRKNAGTDTERFENYLLVMIIRAVSQLKKTLKRGLNL